MGEGVYPSAEIESGLVARPRLLELTGSVQHAREVLEDRHVLLVLLSDAFLQDGQGALVELPRRAQVPHSLGEQPKVGERPSTGELTEFVKERLSSFKAPKYYDFVDDLPRNYLGKVLKTDLRKQFGEAKSGS